MGRKKNEPNTGSFELYEDEIIRLAAEGNTVLEMADIIKPRLQWRTISRYVKNIKVKWGARNTPNLVHLWHLKQKENGQAH